MRFWCQLGSIFFPKIHQNPKRNRLQDASNFGLIFRQIFHQCWLGFGGQLGAMLATDSPKEPCKTGLNTRPKRPRPPRATKTSKMGPKSRWGTPPGLVFGANMAAFGPSYSLTGPVYLFFCWLVPCPRQQNLRAAASAVRPLK